MKPVISVNNIGKQYTLGSETVAGQSFREMLVGILRSPFQKFKRLRGTDETQDTFWAVSGVSFEVKPGEVVGIIGRNGAGKSTLLKILSRITTPTQGTITYHGRLASLLEVGTGFHPELTGRENIYLNGAILGLTRKEVTERMSDIVEFAEIDKFLDTPVKRFSSGMYVRLAFSVAAHLDPDILIVDEVLAVGDQTFQKKCLGKLKDSANGGRTVLFVSHNMNAVRSLCSRILYVKDGNIEFDGEPEEAIGRYLASDLSTTSGWEDHDGRNQYLSSVSVGTESKPSTNLIQYSDPIHVNIVIRNAQRRGVVAAVRVTDAFGNAIFTSWETDCESLERKTNYSRRHVTCIIPSKLLKVGDYTITAFTRFSDDSGRIAVEEANLNISVSSERTVISSDRLGIIAPLLKWSEHDKS